MVRNAREVINETAERYGWTRAEHRLHEHVFARGAARMILGYSSTGRALSVAMYFPEGVRQYVGDPEPMRSVGRGGLDVVLSWLRTGDPDPVDAHRAGLVVIPCAAAKKAHPLPASELYDSAHFRFTLRAAQARAKATGARVAILSAKHGLVDPATQLSPYDVTIGDPEATSARVVAGQLAVWRIGYIEALLPARYLALARAAAEQLHRGGTVFRLDDLYGTAPGIGYQRAVLADLLRRP